MLIEFGQLRVIKSDRQLLRERSLKCYDATAKLSLQIEKKFQIQKSNFQRQVEFQNHGECEYFNRIETPYHGMNRSRNKIPLIVSPNKFSTKQPIGHTQKSRQIISFGGINNKDQSIVSIQLAANEVAKSKNRQDSLSISKSNYLFQRLNKESFSPIREKLSSIKKNNINYEKPLIKESTSIKRLIEGRSDSFKAAIEKSRSKKSKLLKQKQNLTPNTQLNNQYYSQQHSHNFPQQKQKQQQLYTQRVIRNPIQSKTMTVWRTSQVGNRDLRNYQQTGLSCEMWGSFVQQDVNNSDILAEGESDKGGIMNMEPF